MRTASSSDSRRVAKWRFKVGGTTQEGHSRPMRRSVGLSSQAQTQVGSRALPDEGPPCTHKGKGPFPDRSRRPQAGHVPLTSPCRQ